MSAEQRPTFRNVCSTFATFLNVAIHQVLHDRQLYPQTSFMSVSKYRLAVRQSRHPKVCEWINDSTACVQEQMLKDSVERVAIVIYTKTHKPIERYVFDVSLLPTVAEDDADVVLQLDEGESGDSVLPMVDLEEQFRAVLSRLSSSTSSLKGLPQGCTFTIAIELKMENPQAPIQHPQAWIPAVPRSGHIDDPHEKPKTIPVRAVAGGVLAFDAWVEESVRPNPKEDMPLPKPKA